MGGRQATTLAHGTPAGPAAADASRLSDRGGSQDLAGVQRTRLIRAMCEVCAEQDAGDVSVAHVVARAGVSRRTFYETFADREDCFLAAFDDAVGVAGRHAATAYEAQSGWSEKVRGCLEALLGLFDAEPAIGRLLVVASQAGGPGVLERRCGVVDDLVAMVDRGREASGRESSLTPLTAEGVVGGAIAVVHRRMVVQRGRRLLELLNPLTSMIVLPYLGARAASAELQRPVRSAPIGNHGQVANPLGSLDMRLTYRTMRVLAAVDALPGASNRRIGEEADIGDQGQISKLLGRLHGLGLVENDASRSRTRSSNSWHLTQRGREVADVLTAP